MSFLGHISDEEDSDFDYSEEYNFYNKSYKKISTLRNTTSLDVCTFSLK